MVHRLRRPAALIAAAAAVAVLIGLASPASAQVDVVDGCLGVRHTPPAAVPDAPSTALLAMSLSPELAGQTVDVTLDNGGQASGIVADDGTVELELPLYEYGPVAIEAATVGGEPVDTGAIAPIVVDDAEPGCAAGDLEVAAPPSTAPPTDPPTTEPETTSPPETSAPETTEPPTVDPAPTDTGDDGFPWVPILVGVAVILVGLIILVGPRVVAGLFGYTKCTVGTCRNFGIMGIESAPYGDKPGDYQKAKNKITAIGVGGAVVAAGGTVVWFFATGGIAAAGIPAFMQRAATAKGLNLNGTIDKIQSANAKKNGLAVWLLVEQECCVKGVFSTYWKKCKVHRIPLDAPSDYAMTHVPPRAFQVGYWSNAGFLQKVAPKVITDAITKAQKAGIPCK